MSYNNIRLSWQIIAYQITYALKILFRLVQTKTNSKLTVIKKQADITIEMNETFTTILI